MLTYEFLPCIDIKYFNYAPLRRKRLRVNQIYICANDFLPFERDEAQKMTKNNCRQPGDTILPHRNPHRALEIKSLADNSEKWHKFPPKKKKKEKSPKGKKRNSCFWRQRVSKNHNNSSGRQTESGSDSPVSHDSFASDLCCQCPEWGDGCAAVSSGQVLLTNHPRK